MEEKKGTREWLIKAREEKGYTQVKLGSLVGTSGNAITQYEKGKRFPKPDTLRKICKELEINVELFYQ